MVGWSSKAIAHGAAIQYRQTQAVQIQANYSDGTPMNDAQVTIYAPDDPQNPKFQGTTDADGQFSFVPDIEGNWDVKVRQSGHGDIVTIPVDEQQIDNSTWSGGESYSPMQKAVMAAAGVWGFVGTALFFARKSSPKL